MSEQIQKKILSHIESETYLPQLPRRLARELSKGEEGDYHAFRDALRGLMDEGRVILGARGAIMLPTQALPRNEFTGTFRQNRRGFGFVIPTDPDSREDLFIPPGENGGAMTGDSVRAKITSRGQRDGKAIHSGRIIEILQRKNKRFVGTLNKHRNEWFVLPDGNTLIEPILTPDAASRHIRPGVKVVVELTTYPEVGKRAQGVITEVLGQAGEKDVDLKSVIVQFNLPEDFPDEVKEQARQAVDSFDPEEERAHRLDLTDEIVCTIDPDDAKDYDDAISLRQLKDGLWELGVHIADVSFFVEKETPLDVEAQQRGNSTYFPGHVIPMLPVILSNGVCSLQEGVPRLCKSAFITYGDDARPVSARFANTIIKSRKRLRYREAQAIIDNAREVPHPDGPRKVGDYEPEIVDLLGRMNALARRLQQRRRSQGQLVLDLPRVELVLDEDGKVVGAEPEDHSYTHTLIEMFMVEANEAVARLLHSHDVPFLRRAHPEPEVEGSERLRHFVQVSGYKLPREMDRKAIQALLENVKGKPESFAISLAILKSLTRAEYSPEQVGHYALASEHYCHFTSPIRRYADLTIHRLLDEYFAQGGDDAARGGRGKGGRKRRKMEFVNAPSHDDLVTLGKHISVTERRSEDAERELRQVKILTLLQGHVGDVFQGVVTGITNFGVFVQLEKYLVDGLIRYEHLMDDWWDVDDRGGYARGQRTGTKIAIGDVVEALIVRVDLARRELDLSVTKVRGRSPGTAPAGPKGGGAAKQAPKKKAQHRKGKPKQDIFRGGESRRDRKPGKKRH